MIGNLLQPELVELIEKRDFAQTQGDSMQLPGAGSC